MAASGIHTAHYMWLLVIRARRLGRAEGALKEINSMLMRRIFNPMNTSSLLVELTPSSCTGPYPGAPELTRPPVGSLMTTSGCWAHVLCSCLLRSVPEEWSCHVEMVDLDDYVELLSKYKVLEMLGHMDFFGKVGGGRSCELGRVVACCAGGGWLTYCWGFWQGCRCKGCALTNLSPCNFVGLSLSRPQVDTV